MRRLRSFAWLTSIAWLALAGCQALHPSEIEDDKAARMAWWREARFGLFLHWGLYAIPAGRWGEQSDHGEWIMTTAEIPVEEYEQFVQQFDPVDFNAREWVRLARRAGMRYVVITSKHHDGFCLFDSELTDYDIASTPFERDIMAEMAEACREEGLRLGWYHSIMDWHHPDYLPRRTWEERSAEGASFERYVEHLQGHVRELLTNYGPIGVMWFDGEGESTWTHEHGQALYELCRELQPDVIVNNRVDKGRAGMAGITTDPKYAGDFGTPEQEIPAAGLTDVDWETCMTMNRHWGWNAQDEDWKSTEHLVRKLVEVASKGGNFLLNVGPTAEGRFPEQAVERLHGIGQWMDLYSEAIHGTQASPFEDLDWGRCTTRPVEGGTRLYLCIFDWPEKGRLVVPGLGNLVWRAWSVSEPARPVGYQKLGPNLHLQLPKAAQNPICSVIAVEVQGELAIYRRPTITAHASTFVHPLAVRLETASDELELHYTLDGSTPELSSPLYENPIQLEQTTTVQARAFLDGEAVSDSSERTFHRVEARAAVSFEETRGGLRLSVYEGEWKSLPDFRSLEPTTQRIAPAPALTEELAREGVGAVFEGSLAVPAEDLWIFSLSADDGARLWIDGQLVADQGGLHGAARARGEIPLAKGRHGLRLEWFNKAGGSALDLRMGRVGDELEAIPVDAFEYEH